MAVRFKARSVVPGAKALKASALSVVAGYPAVANTWYGSGGFGTSGTEFTPTKRASSIANCVAGNVKNLVTIDDVTGTYVGGTGDAVFPAAANVWHGTVAYGPTGADYTPSKVASSITNCTAGNVRVNVAIDDVTGTYGPAQALVVDPDPTDALAIDAARFLTDFGESVVYRPAAVGAATRTIVAVVNRPEPQPAGPVNAWEGMAITVTVANNATTGISAAELDSGRDKVDVALRVGGAVTARPIVGIVSQDSGMLTLEVR